MMIYPLINWFLSLYCALIQLQCEKEKSFSLLLDMLHKNWKQAKDFSTILLGIELKPDNDHLLMVGQNE